MPYYRRGRYSRGRRSRRGRYSRGRRYPRAKPSPTYAQIGHKLWKDVQMLKGLVNTEFKYKDTAFTTSVNNTGVITILNNTPQGDASDERDGSQVRFKSVQLRGKIVMDSLATHTQYRQILFIKKRVNNTLPTVTDVLASASTTALPNLDNRRNITILQDRVINLDPGSTEIKYIKWYRKLDMKTLWERDDVSGASSAMEQNGLYLLQISSNGTNAPNLTWNARVSYVDN